MTLQRHRRMTDSGMVTAFKEIAAKAGGTTERVR
jgi:hypothetical protein